MNNTFREADILLPKGDFEKWSVVACDQYTSDSDYWNRVKEFVGSSKSTLKLMVPEIYLEEASIENRIENTQKEMVNYLKDDAFIELKDEFILTRRVLESGKTRIGVVGVLDLEDYNYEKGSKSVIRATEATILDRIPPRVKVRSKAEIELPHIIVLIDDDKKEILENINVKEENLKYDFDLMENGGHIKGYTLDKKEKYSLKKSLKKLYDINSFNEKYGVNEKSPLVYAVGDGNHSLATAKKCYENYKFAHGLTKDHTENLKCRYALVEINNLHDESLEFSAIHRVLFNVDYNKFIKELEKFYNVSYDGAGQVFEIVNGDEIKKIGILNPKSNLTVGSVQIFIDYYLDKFGGKVDYIHGSEHVKALAKKGNIGLLFDKMEKSELFKTVIVDGALPRKTFSMGHADDKRYYLECRKIKD